MPQPVSGAEQTEARLVRLARNCANAWRRSRHLGSTHLRLGTLVRVPRIVVRCRWSRRRVGFRGRRPIAFTACREPDDKSCQQQRDSRFDHKPNHRHASPLPLRGDARHVYRRLHYHADAARARCADAAEPNAACALASRDVRRSSRLDERPSGHGVAGIRRRMRGIDRPPCRRVGLERALPGRTSTACADRHRGTSFFESILPHTASLARMTATWVSSRGITSRCSTEANGVARGIAIRCMRRPTTSSRSTWESCFPNSRTSATRTPRG